MPVTNQPLTISYFIDDISGALATFDSIRWWKSSTGVNGLYEQITAAAASSAVLTGTRDGNHYVNGKELRLRIDGVTEISHTFTGADPLTTAEAVTELLGVAAGTFVPSSSAGNLLVLTSATTGTGSSIEVLESEAAPFLGISGTALGQAADTPLVAGTHEYYFTDQNSDYDYWYKIQLLHSLTLDRSELSAPISADQVIAVPSSQTIVGYINLAAPSGRPMPDTTIRIFNDSLPNSRAGYGVVRFYEETVTDRNGYAKIRLLRGITVTMNIVGTGITRQITIPTTGDAFDLLDPALVANDEFGIHYQDIPSANRTS
jgi:hypothetical protein